MAEELFGELLELGGETPKVEEAAQTVTQTEQQALVTDTVKLSVEPSAEPALVKAANPKQNAKASKKAGGRAKADESEEEGEASSGRATPDSQQSASMDESESDATAAGDLDKTVSFPLENKYKSEEDKKYILSLTEFEREKELATRAAELELENQNRALRQLLRDREKAQGKEDEKKKRKADGEPEDGQRKTSRQRTTRGGRKVGEASAPLEEYKRHREQRGKEHEQRRRLDDVKPQQQKRDELSDADGDGESDVEWDDKKPKAQPVRPAATTPTTPPQDLRIPELRNFERVRVGWEEFARVCFFPGFEQAITGCFVRVVVGKDEHRMGQIKGFTEGPSYAMHPTRGLAFVTNQYVTVTLGKAQKDFAFLYCSGSRFTEAEFRRYRITMEFDKCPMPSRKFLVDKIGAINALSDRRWTNDEINAKVKRVDDLTIKHQKVARLRESRKEAEARGQDAVVNEIDQKLADLNVPNLAFGTHIIKPKETKERTQQDILAEINRRNRQLNTQEVRKAQIAEKKAERELAAAVARGERLPDHFARVKTQPRLRYDANEPIYSASRSRTGTPVTRSGTVTPKSKSPESPPALRVSPRTSGEKKKGIPTFSKQVLDDDLIAAMDVAIDIEI